MQGETELLKEHTQTLIDMTLTHQINSAPSYLASTSLDDTCRIWRLELTSGKIR
jgi:hypothetical protein